MKVQLFLSTITILLLFRTTFTLDGETTSKTGSLKSKQSALRNLALYAEQNQEATCSDDISEILYFLELGQRDIEKTDVKDVVIVVGPSGVGKSTLTQFVGNETNTLRAECDLWGECVVVDDSSTIGRDIISKTFLPNLVFHESTQTPFYDMPGFNDNRNESMEIANSFFMQQILEDAETIKILVLARYNFFEVSAKLEFPNLLRNLVDLIKSPAKFRGGMALISTMALHYLPHENIIGRNTKFLKEYLLDDISEIFNGDEKYIRGSTEILENWLVPDTENYDIAKYFSYFLSASNPGPLLEDPLLFNNKKFLEEVIWDRLKFVKKEHSDFGLPMSAAALRKLEMTGSCIFNSLVKHMETFAVDLENYILTNLSNLFDGNEIDIAHISALLTNLTNSDFLFDNMEGQPLSSYTLRLLSEVSNLEIPSLQETRQQIKDALIFIQFIELTNSEIQFDPKMWVMRLLPIVSNLTWYFKDQGLLDAAISSLAEEAKAIGELLLTNIESLNDISEKEGRLSFEVVRVINIFEKINSVNLTPTKKLTDFLDFYLSEYDKLRDCQSCSSIPEFKAFSLWEILDDISWSSKNWTAASILKLQKPLEIEKDLTIFLRALFNDLSLPIVQTGANSAIYTWWNNQTQLTEGNFDTFFANVNIQGFSTLLPLLSDKSRVNEFVFYTTKGTKRLEFLLDFMLGNVYNCSGSSEIIVTGPIISFDRIISRCVNTQTTSSIVLLATHKIYANAKVIGRQINSNNNINVILMSPEILVSENSEIDLSGNAGQQDVAGKPAGTQYSLYRKISTSNDGSIPSQITFPNVSGGPGLDGEIGGVGEVGSSGSNYFDYQTDDCAAWQDGAVQIRNYVNSCNNYNDKNTFCYPGRYGQVIMINGTSGGQGTKGGVGKDGSCGGAGGQSYSVNANIFLLPKTATNGLQGINGVGGDGGPGGLGGLYGPTRFVHISYYYDGWFNYRCYQFHQTVDTSIKRGSRGPTGSIGKACTSSVTRKTVNKTEVTNRFASFKAALASLDTNEFLYLYSTSFLNLLGSAPPLD